MNIIRKDNGKKGAFLAVEDGVQLGEMSYVWSGENKIIIDHTGVDTMHEGEGIGRSLFDAAVDFSRKEKIQVIPVCPFVVAMFRRTPENKDVLAN